MITTVVGSYPKIGAGLRGPNLRNAIARFDQGRMTREELERVEDEATREVIEEQARAGLDLVSDGMVRWDDGQTYLAGGIEGFAINGLIRYFDTNTYYRQPVVEGPLAWKGPITVDDFRFAAAASPRPVKAVLTGPYTLARLSQDSHYGDLRRVVLALAEALNQEARALQEAGASVVQFEEPALLKHKGDFPLFRDAMERLTSGLSPTLALYTYFGDVSGLYPELFRLPFQVFGLDYVVGRSNWQVVRDFPQDRCLGLGIVDARNTRLETEEELSETVRRASEVVPPERLYVSPNCGLEFLPRDRAYSKLARMVEGVRKGQEALA